MYKNIINYLYSCAPILLIITTMGWGTNTIVAKVSVNQISPMMIVFLRWFLLSIILLYLQKKNLKTAIPIIKSRIIWFLLMGGIGICCFNSLFYIAAYYTTAINLGVIQSSQPALVIVLSYFLYKNKISLIQFLGLLFTFLGVLFVVSNGKLDLILAGFHETTLAVQEAYKRIHPGERVPFGYTTSNSKLQEKLGVKK